MLVFYFLCFSLFFLNEILQGKVGSQFLRYLLLNPIESPYLVIVHLFAIETIKYNTVSNLCFVNKSYKLLLLFDIVTPYFISESTCAIIRLCLHVNVLAVKYEKFTCAQSLSINVNRTFVYLFN